MKPSEFRFFQRTVRVTDLGPLSALHEAQIPEIRNYLPGSLLEMERVGGLLRKTQKSTCQTIILPLMHASEEEAAASPGPQGTLT